MKAKGKVYAYIRVSDIGQLEPETNSLDTQRDLVIRKAHLLVQANDDIDVGQVFTERAVSAFKKPLLKRPSGSSLDAVLKKGDHVVFARLDRGFRRIRDCVNTIETWAERGVTVHILDLPYDTSTVMGRGMLHFAALMAEMESGQKSERQKARYAHARLNNLRNGPRPPYGKRWVNPKKNGHTKLADDPLDEMIYVWTKRLYILLKFKRVKIRRVIVPMALEWYRENKPGMDDRQIKKAISKRLCDMRVHAMMRDIDRVRDMKARGITGGHPLVTAEPEPFTYEELEMINERASWRNRNVVDKWCKGANK